MRRAGLALALAACGASLWSAWSWWPALESLLGARAWLLAAALLAAPLAAGLVLARPELPGPAGIARALLAGLGLAWTGFLACAPRCETLWLELALGPAAALLALALAFERATGRLAPSRAKLARALFLGLALAPPCAEAALRLAARLRPSPLFARAALAPARLLEANRPAAGKPRFGMPLNSGGHFDGEFQPRREGQTRVALIGDSFSQGVVPHALHYSTVAERAVGFPVDNLGVPGIGLPEYELLLVREALPLDPSAVVVAVFVGNDLDLPPEEEPRASWLDRRSALVWLVPQRLARIAQERRSNPLGAAGVQGESAALDPAEALEARFPWIADPRLEEPTISVEGFRRLERARARQACGLPEAELARAVAILERLRAESAGRPFGVLLVPDEFQVEDALWAEVEAPGLERDRPQRLLLRELGARGIPVLDLEPVLRSVEPLADGGRHLYHLRDTHWNARGNRAAGEALAGFVRELLRGRPR